MNFYRHFATTLLMAGIATFLVLAGALPTAPVAAHTQSASSLLATELVTTARPVPGEESLAPLDAQGRRLYVVRLAEPSLAAYTGGIARLAPTSPAATGARRLDINAPASQVYRHFLAGRHASVLHSLAGELGRQAEPAFTYLNVLNAMAVSLTPEEAARAERLPGVHSVTPDRIMEIDTDIGPERIGAPAIWDGDNLPETTTRGEGVIVGVIDTGINPDHPAFAATDMDGYTHTNPYGPGNFVGECVDQPAFCNDKLIGAWNFYGSWSGPGDRSGHGSHVASTAAGNRHVAEFEIDGQTQNTEISGVAPRANLVSYRVCDWLCPHSAIVAAIDQAIADGVDVLNYSISGTDDPWRNVVDQAFLDAFAANVIVAASAGNYGPTPGNVTRSGPWSVTVAASTQPRIVAQTLHLKNGPKNVPVVQGNGPAMTADYFGTLRWAGDVDAGNVEGCHSFPANSFDGQAALIARGSCYFALKVNHAAAAGADFVVIYNDVGGTPIRMGLLGLTDIPSVMVDKLVGADLIAALDGGAEAVHVEVALDMFHQESYADLVAAFSSRGPSRFDLMAPTFTAPGARILAAAATSEDNDPNQWAIRSGTSMSSPHAAGAAALLRALHPDWSPARIRSALALGANPEPLRKHGDLTPADPFDQGSGLLDLQAAGRLTLVMDETATNFANANPDTGGDPRTLNVPHLVDRHCPQTCTWTRTVTHVDSSSLAYQATDVSPAGLDITITPSSFTLDPGQTRSLTIDVHVDRDLLPTDDWAFAEIVLEPVGVPTGSYATARMPLAIGPFKDTPALTLDHESLASTQVPDRVMQQTMTIGNVGTAELQWSTSEEQTEAVQQENSRSDDFGDMECNLPDWLSVSPTGGTVDHLQHRTLTLTIDSAGLTEGTYTGQFCLETNDPDAFWVEIPVELTVINPALIEATPGSLSFALDPGTTNDKELVVTNVVPSGDQELEWSIAGSELLQEGVGQAFTGHFDFSNWNLVNSPPEVNGHFSTEPTPPMEVFITGGDDGVGGHTDLWIEIPFDGTITFDWGYTSRDYFCRDLGAYVINGILMPLACNWHPIRYFEETTVVHVSAGDIFAFRVHTVDGSYGAGVLGVTNFQFMPDRCDPPSAVDWLSPMPDSGITAPGESDPVTVSVDTDGLGVGHYDATLCMFSNDPFSDLVAVPVWLNVKDDIFHDRFEVDPDSF